MRIVFFILLVVSAFQLAVAQERRMTPDQRRERVETVIIGKFAEELELSPEEAEKFFPRLRQFRTETEDLQRQLHDTRGKLDALSEQPMKTERSTRDEVVSGVTAKSVAPRALSESAVPTEPDEAGPDDVKSLISKSNSLQTDILAKREKLLTDLADFLSPQQVSRCSILLDELPRRLRQFMDERGQQPDRPHERPKRRGRQTR